MSIKKEVSGKRSVEFAMEVPGTPEDVWQAIASASGISSWFVPAEFEEKDGKPVALKLNFGDGMEAKSAITSWQPPYRWSSQADGWTPDSPPIASEWIVESRDGGKCILRIVYSHFADSDTWDDQLEGTKAGLTGFIRTLLIYLTHFRGQQALLKQCLTQVPGDEAEAWIALTSALGLQGLQVGDRFTSAEGVPQCNGVVEYYSERPYDALLKLDQPIPGIAAVGAFNCGPTIAGLNFYFYGDRAADIHAAWTPRWESWLRQCFASAPASSDLK